MNIEKLFFELIRVAIGNQVCLSRTPKMKEWAELYAMAKKQSLVGICFAGVQKLQAQRQAPNSWGNEQGQLLYLQWMGMAAKIQQRNEVVNRRCVEIQEKLATDGLCSCILKGQGAACLYRETLRTLRQSGDIDIWIKADRTRIISYVNNIAPTKDVRDNHITFGVFDDTEVEPHFKPATLRNPIRNKLLQGYFARVNDGQFSNIVPIPNGKIIVPTSDFNVVYMLVHIFEHFYTEGVGLRQLMDYYYVLQSIADKSSLSESRKIVKKIGLEPFARALMWVLAHVFKLESDCMPWMPDSIGGKVVLDEVLQTGNFGKSDERQKGLYDNKWNSFWMVHQKTLRFWRFDHWAWFWSPIWRIHSFVSRKCF